MRSGIQSPVRSVLRISAPVAAMLAMSVAAGWINPDTNLEDSTNSARIAASDLQVPSAPPLRDLSDAPLTKILQHAGCHHGAGCVTGSDVMACAMYAPGYRPKSAVEDTPNVAISSEFNVRPGAQWPQPGGKGSPVTITYSYSNLLDSGMNGISVPNLQAAVEEALSVWAAAAPLDFVEVSDSGPLPTAADEQYSASSTPNLRFGHHVFDGPSGVLAHAFFPLSTATSGLAGDLHFDEGETWGTSPGPGRIDFLEVCVHEIGHSLGLDHQNPPRQAIMNPFYGARYNGLGTAFLFFDDRRGITRIYGRGSLTRQAMIEQAFEGDFSFVVPVSVRSRLGL